MSAATNRSVAGVSIGVVRRQIRGVRLLFWAELSCAVFMNVYGGALPIIGGLSNWSMQSIQHLFDAGQILPPFAAIIAARGVFYLIDVTDRPVSQFLLKIVVVSEVLFRFRISARAIGVELVFPTPFWIARHLIYSVVVCGVFFLCAAKLASHGDSLRSRRIRSAGLALAGFTILRTFGTAFLGLVVDVDATVVSVIEFALFGVIGTWSFYALWSASTALRYVLEGRCIMCGYRLDRLPTLRCPECGTEFTPTEEGTQVGQVGDLPLRSG